MIVLDKKDLEETMAANKKSYDNTSISSLKGADRVRLRPGVILVQTELTAAAIAFLKFYQTPLTKRVKDMEISLRSGGIWITH